MKKTINNALNVARKGVSVLKNNSRSIVAVSLAFAAVSTAHAQTTPTIDLDSVTDGISAANVAMVGIAAAVIASGIAVGAIKWGSRFGISLFKIFGK